MSSPEERWWSVRAGEYVLGTLRGPDLELFERILHHDSDMQAEVARWQERLQALNDTTADRPPGPHVWTAIERRIREQGGATRASAGQPDAAAGIVSGRPESGDSLPDQPLRPLATADSSSPKPTDARSTPWRAIAGLASAACLVLTLLMGVMLSQRAELIGAPLQVDGLAVVLSDENGEPYFLVETDYGNLQVRVTALTPPSIEEDRRFQLWQALPDRSSVRPVALLPQQSGRSQIYDVTSLIDGSDLFGVSIEPVGASTDEGPTGPVVAHGDYLQTQAVPDGL